MSLRLTGPHIQATGYRQGRDRKMFPANRITFLVAHSGEGATDEISLLTYLRNLGTASCSASIGQDGGYATGVRYADTPWTNPPIHDDTETMELCGFAAWTREQWLAQPAMLETFARWLAWRSAVNKIPLRLVKGDQIRRGVKGVCDHSDINDVFGQSSHWDVGASLPWDVVLPRARQIRYGDKTPTPAPTTPQPQEDFMATKEDRAQLIIELLDTPINIHDPKGDPKFQGVTVREALKAAAAANVAKYTDGGK